jgi:translation initiation factor 5B
MSGNPMNSIKEAYACILAFNVPVLPDAERLAKEIGIPIYTAEIIYHLFDAFTKRVNDIKARKKEEARKKAVYPVVFKIVDERCVFNKKDPYILGVDVLEGELKLGTPVLIPDVKWTGNAATQEPAKELLEFGQARSAPPRAPRSPSCVHTASAAPSVAPPTTYLSQRVSCSRSCDGRRPAGAQVMSIEKDKKPIDSANRLTGSVAIRIEQRRNMREYTFGRHWTHESMFVSRLNRESIDLLKEHFREDVPKDDWKLVVKIKKLLNIP